MTRIKYPEWAVKPVDIMDTIGCVVMKTNFVVRIADNDTESNKEDEL